MKKNMNLRAAVIDLYNNEKNEGMRCIKELLTEAGERFPQSGLQFEIFESRYKGDVPGSDYDIYISSGGPGSPFDDEGKEWEKKYFALLDAIWNNNQTKERKKYIFFICHSFQMMARHFHFAEVTKRHKKSFGVHQFLQTEEGAETPIFRGLLNPFYAADFRQFQVVNPNDEYMKEFGAVVLSKEMQNGDGHEPALMAVKLSEEIQGTQFHPEADPDSMIYHLRQPERKEYVVSEYGEEMYFRMIADLEDPQKIKLTRKTVIPNFLNNAITTLLEKSA